MDIKIINENKEQYRERFIELMSYCFKMCKEEDFIKDWDGTTTESEAILGAIEGEDLASCIIMPYRQMYVDGKVLAMTGLGGVTTTSTYRKGGVCSTLIKEGLKHMYEKGAVYSMLAPFSYEFYQKLGWKWCYNNIHLGFEIERLKGVKGSGTVEFVKPHQLEELNAFYERSIQKLNGACVREAKHWEKRMSRQLDHYTVISRNEKQEIEGYMIYKIVNDNLTFNVVEIQYATIACLKTFFNYIYSHSAQVTKVTIAAKEHDIILDVLSNPRCEVRLESYMMGRIIDVKKALEHYTFYKEGSFVLEVKDDVCEWNEGKFKVTIGEGVKVEKTEEDAEMMLDIRELAQVLLGFRTLEEVMEGAPLKSYFKPMRSKVALYDFF